MALTTGIVLFDGAEELDWAGPWEVVTSSAMVADQGDQVITVAERLEPVRCAKGLRVLPDHTFQDCPRLDVVLVPGGQGTRTQMRNEVLTGWLGDVAQRARWTTSVCTGSFVLWGAGLLAGKRVTTHWAAVEELLGHAPDLDIDRDARWVVDGDVVTAAGVSAGIDMALWLIGQLHDPGHARLVQRYIQYEPDPPYQDVPLT